MTVSLGQLLELARFSIQEPRQAARAILAARVPMNMRWLGFLLAGVLSTITVHLYLGLFPAEEQAGIGFTQVSPFVTLVLDLIFNLAVAYLVFAVGRWRGGKGSFADSLVLIVCLQLILLLPQILQLVAAVILPPLSNIIGLLSVVLYFWLISNFTAEIHGFASARTVFVGVVLTMIAVVFLMAFLLLPFIGPGI